MITPEEFPYIKSLYVNDCYAYKDFNIELHDYKPFSHLILTGKNGSGKSTILRVIDRHLQFVRKGEDPKKHIFELLQRFEDSFQKDRALLFALKALNPVILELGQRITETWKFEQSEVIFSFLQAGRQIKPDNVSSVVKNSEMNSILLVESEVLIKKIKQYLVNKKVNQAFNQLNENKKRVAEAGQFFDRLTYVLRNIFEDDHLNLEFYQENFEFLIILRDGRQLTFDVLPEGFSALLSILLDLLIRVDLIRKQVNDYSYDPCGIVLIDEPETHLHLQLQEQVLPLLTSLFPNIQFIAATHSPAVIASIKQATIFDLTTKESRISEETAGRSYSDLMRGHFGLNNEYSGIADTIFKEVDRILKDYKNQPELLKSNLQQLLIENEAYLSPSFRIEIEAMILENA